MYNNRVKRKKFNFFVEIYDCNSVWLCGLMPFKLLLVICIKTIKHGSNFLLLIGFLF